jgi:phosphotransferase system enzyme I (PtsI)
MRDALARASSELTALIARSQDNRGAGDAAGADAAEILEFQVAMLEDETLVAPVLEAIAAGSAAHDAWIAAMDAQIRDYEVAGDPYFRARASDLRDMRDRVSRAVAGGSAACVPAGAIVVAADLPPSRFLEIAWNGGGIALYGGSPTSHVAVLARARGVPMIVALERTALPANGEALLDADNGTLTASPDSASIAEFSTRQRAAELAHVADEAFLEGPAMTARGERIRVMLNVADIGELAGIAQAHCDGIGLVRTELMLHTVAELADEERQFALYRTLVEWAQGRPVTIRTFDAGGDKPIEGYTVAGELNPFLGLRGVRLSLLHADLLAIQLRAIARAAALGPVKIMLPMVTQPAELDDVRALLDAAVHGLRSAGVACAVPGLGMMVEVPAAAIAIDGFRASFFSIGSNDLIQYLTACSRDSGRLAALSDPLQPAVLRLIREVAEYGASANIDVSLCGDMASDARCLPALLMAGVRSISIAPAALARVKAQIARFGGAIGG